MLDELQQQKKLIEEQDKSESSCSDSEPDEDELEDDEKICIFPKSMLSKKLKMAIQAREDEKNRLSKMLKKDSITNIDPANKPDTKKPLSKQRFQPAKKEAKKPDAKEGPLMVDKAIQTDASFLQEYRAYMLKKSLMSKPIPPFANKLELQKHAQSKSYQLTKSNVEMAKYYHTQQQQQQNLIIQQQARGNKYSDLTQQGAKANLNNPYLNYAEAPGVQNPPERMQVDTAKSLPHKRG